MHFDATAAHLLPEGSAGYLPQEVSTAFDNAHRALAEIVDEATRALAALDAARRDGLNGDKRPVTDEQARGAYAALALIAHSAGWGRPDARLTAAAGRVNGLVDAALNLAAIAARAERTRRLAGEADAEGEAS